MRLPKRRVRQPAALVLVGALLLLSAVVVVLGPEPEPLRGAPTEVGTPPRPPATATAPPRPGPERPAPAAGLTAVAARWRVAILENKRHEVLALVAELRRQPTGRADLLLLAGDGEERVRAYALRELGRRREAALASVFSASLADPSPPVRENARWALDELAR